MALAVAFGALLPQAARGAVAVPVDACNAPNANGVNEAWIDFGNGMGAFTGCPMETWSGPGGSGFQQASRLAFFAPPGTTIDSIQWGGEWGKWGDCGWSTELRAVNIGQGSSSRLTGIGANQSCNSGASTGDGTLALGAPQGTNAIFQQVECGRASCLGGGNAWVKTRYVRVVLLDFTPPTVSLGNGALGSRSWVRGEQGINFYGQDNVGIRQAELTIDGRGEELRTGSCNWTRPAPCSNMSASLGSDTREFSDGQHTLRVTVLDAGGLDASASTPVFIDNNAPERVDVGVAGGERWRRRNGFEVSWPNPPEAHAPLAGVRYRMCRAGTDQCVDGSRDGKLDRLDGLEVPGSGDWALQLWRVDEAGNGSDSDAQRSAPVRLRLDTDSPELAFEPQDPDDPLKVSVDVRDATSGVAGGSIEIRRKGGRAWNEVDAWVERGRLVGYVDDQALADGAYELRALATDEAGNTGSTDRLANGAAAGLRLPVRVPTRLRAGFLRKRMLRKVLRRGGRKRIVRRRVLRLVPRGRVGIGRAVTLHGRLTNPDGQPIDGATIEVSGKGAFEDDGFASLGFVRTGADGGFTYRARGTESRVIRFHYRGGRRIRAATRDVFLSVPASSTIGVSDRSVLNGDSVDFRGRLRGGAVPEGGKLLEIQAFFRDRWRTFSTVRTDPRGRWRFGYQFGGTTGLITYRFRVVIPREGGYPFDTGRSRVVRVTVRGP